MARRNGAARPGVARLARRIDQWREAGRPGKRMPEALWESAILLAREHGAYRVAIETGLNYQKLKQRTEGSSRPVGKVARGGVEFVELESDQFLAGGFGGGSVIEVERRDGARLRIRIGAGQTVDVAQVAAAFVGDQR